MGCEIVEYEEFHGKYTRFQKCKSRIQFHRGDAESVEGLRNVLEDWKRTSQCTYV